MENNKIHIIRFWKCCSHFHTCTYTLIKYYDLKLIFESLVMNYIFSSICTAEASIWKLYTKLQCKCCANCKYLVSICKTILSRGLYTTSIHCIEHANLLGKCLLSWKITSFREIFVEIVHFSEFYETKIYTIPNGLVL